MNNAGVSLLIVKRREFKSCKWRGILDTTLCDTVCQLHVAGRWFSRVLWFPPPIKLSPMI